MPDSNFSPNLLEKSVFELGQLMADGVLSALTLTDWYLERIQRFNPQLRALNCINPDSREIARQLDTERLAGKVRGPLHGIPVVIKDNIDSGDQMPNTAGSLLMTDNLPASDAHLVTRLRDAGAIILGKANLSEWANFRSSRSSSGWSAVGGQTRNPYDPNRSPCGSSSGSAVAVAANMAALAVGTETDGSITCPAALCGVVGIKPGLGEVSRTGIIPIAHSQDTAGPIARSMADATLLLSVMAGFDATDPASQETNINYVSHLLTSGLQNKRFGIVENLKGYHPAVEAHFNNAVQLISQHATGTSNCRIANHREMQKLAFQVMLYEFKNGINEYLAQHNHEFASLDALIAANTQLEDREQQHFGQEIFLAAASKGSFQSPDYQQALLQSRNMAGAEGIDAALKSSGADILIAPSTGPAWKIDPVLGDHPTGSASSPAAIAGYPHITVPMGFVAGLPVGISFFTTRGSEGKLIEAAYAFEHLTRKRRPPPGYK